MTPVLVSAYSNGCGILAEGIFNLFEQAGVEILRIFHHASNSAGQQPGQIFLCWNAAPRGA
jgi:hypothetical protein